VAPHTGKCFLKFKENSVKICVILQGFFNLKVKICDGLKRIAVLELTLLKRIPKSRYSCRSLREQFSFIYLLSLPRFFFFFQGVDQFTRLIYYTKERKDEDKNKGRKTVLVAGTIRNHPPGFW